MKTKKNDFVEIDFTGIANDQIFDTTKPKEAKELGVEQEVKPLIVSIGNQMVLKGLDEDLQDKELNKEYSVELEPAKAFGPRNPQLIKTYSLNHFKKQNMNPYPGMTLQLDNTIARVISVSGGRVTMDFNNPLAGKTIQYNYKINKVVTDQKERINALQDFFFKRRFDFTVKDKKVIFKDKMIGPFLDMMKDKFKDMTGFEFVVQDETKKESSKKEDNPKQR